jgi:hypothetical protein
MNIRRIPYARLKAIFKQTRRVSGVDSLAAQFLRRELERRARRKAVRRDH